MASNPPPRPSARRARPPRPYLGLPNNTLTAPTSSDPNRTIGSAGVVKFGGDPQQQFILFAGLWFLNLDFTLADVVKYIHGDKGSSRSKHDTKGKLWNWHWRIIDDMLASQTLWTYIWDIVIYYDAVRGNLPPFETLHRNGETHKVFSTCCNYAVYRHMLKPLEYAVDIERIWHDRTYRLYSNYVMNLWMKLGENVYSLAKTKKTVSSAANPDIDTLQLYYKMKIFAAEYWEKMGTLKVEDVPCAQ